MSKFRAEIEIEMLRIWAEEENTSSTKSVLK